MKPTYQGQRDPTRKPQTNGSYEHWGKTQQNPSISSSAAQLEEGPGSGHRCSPRARAGVQFLIRVLRDTVCLPWGSSAVYLRLVRVPVVFTKESYV